MGRVGLVYGLAVAATAPAVALRLTGYGLPPPAAALLFGLGVLGAGFLLSWAAEATEAHITPGLTLALLTVLPSTRWTSTTPTRPAGTRGRSTSSTPPPT